MISVKVNQQSHVALLDTANLYHYTHRQNYRHYGRLQSYREERYRVPFPGEWHIVVYNNSPLRQIETDVRVR